MTTTNIDTTTFTEEQQDAFVEGWQEAGGYTGDMDTPTPWCAPWTSPSTAEITVSGDDIKNWGAQYWEQCKDEIERLLKEEAEV